MPNQNQRVRVNVNNHLYTVWILTVYKVLCTGIILTLLCTVSVLPFVARHQPARSNQIQSGTYAEDCWER